MRGRGTIWSFVSAVGFLLTVGCWDATGNTHAATQSGTLEDCSERGTGSIDLSMHRYTGVDILAVIDNTEAMTAVESRIAEGFYALIDRLVSPPESSYYNPVENVRFAVVTGDMGLQWGDEGNTEGSPSGMDGCESIKGDNGAFQLPKWTDTDACPTLEDTTFAQTGEASVNANLAAQAACMSAVGTDGCSVQQPFAAAISGLEQNATSFLKHDHFLAVIAVSAQDDCSIADPQLFSTATWQDPSTRAVACSNEEGEGNLMEIDRLVKRLIDLENDAYAVFFAAMVGVPPGENGCEGEGDMLGTCLENESMTLTTETVTFDDGTKTVQFAPACTLSEDGEEILSAAPGRRFVTLAQELGDSSSVYSICNDEWVTAMGSFAEQLQEHLSRQCPCGNPYSYEPSFARIPVSEESCAESDCGRVEASMVVGISRPSDGPDTCPDTLYAGLSDIERAALEAQAYVEYNVPSNEADEKTLFCPVRQLTTPLDCDAADTQWHESSTSGWYYCELQITNPDSNETYTLWDIRTTDALKTASWESYMKLIYPWIAEAPKNVCKGEQDRRLGDSCTYPDFGEFPIQSPSIAFEEGCDCLVSPNPDDLYTPLPPICTVPCTDTCPDGYTCTLIYPMSIEVTEEMSRSYCVPEESVTAYPTSL